ncbi:hypothetical protein HG535_0A07420 [Zygotorulaspora mrakii]|uniref:Mannosyltransferase n=1 Tax=Zygotorulaspora mrakii TaxID=42260 RepID=A0A7H9AWL1_ZYGMR|nr:uncharacterized protein HG535_0A07420 [Zygotorulaspora mrakii]QLG70800.1 hypothetical protein HG535_0A07420 [Zygotorulaspora mrakii]
MRFSYLDSAFLAVAIIYLYRAPFTKVEESFTIQAIHDILNYGIWNLQPYDHFVFPGAVPRTFVGPLIISTIARPFVSILSLIEGRNWSTQFQTQILVRSIIALLNALSLIYLKNSAQALLEITAKEEQIKQDEKRGGALRKPEVLLYTVGTWFSLFIMTGFHMMYYLSRPLPNFVMTLPLTNVAISWILQDNYQWAIFLASFTAVIFRLEVLAFCAGMALFSVVYRKISFFKAVKFGILGFGIGMGITLFIDSYFWQYWCMPEVDSFIFNVVHGNSSKWGVEPFFAYFTHYLRMLFIPPTILLLNLLGFKLAPTNMRIITLGSFFHILVLSFQPHKEWRFIVYAIPSIILLGSVAAAYVWENIEIKSIRNFLLVSLVPLSPLFSAIFSFCFLYISSMNYPGGEALSNFNLMIINQNITNVTVHLDVPICMTGATLFGELNQDVYAVSYDRTEDPETLKKLWPSFDYVITAQPSSQNFPFENATTDNWELLQTAQTYVGLDMGFLNEEIFQKESNLFTLMKDCFTSDVSIIDQAFNLLDRIILRGNVFFTYERKSRE